MCTLLGATAGRHDGGTGGGTGGTQRFAVLNNTNQFIIIRCAAGWGLSPARAATTRSCYISVTYPLHIDPFLFDTPAVDTQPFLFDTPAVVGVILLPAVTAAAAAASTVSACLLVPCLLRLRVLDPSP